LGVPFDDKAGTSKKKAEDLKKAKDGKKNSKG